MAKPIKRLKRNMATSSEKFPEMISVHKVKKLQIWSYFWSVFFRIRSEYGDLGDIHNKYPNSVRIWENRTRKTPDLDTFHAVLNFH